MKSNLPARLRAAASLAVCAVVASLSLLTSACNDDSTIGNTLITPEIKINVDSNFNITGESFHQAEFDSRSQTMLLGALHMDDVAHYSSSVVTQLMAASTLTIPDSIPLDSIMESHLKFNFRRGALTGDSLAPCRLTVYPLTKELPKGISSSFDPTGYYNPSAPLGVKSYTASLLGRSDSAFIKEKFGQISITLPPAFGRNVVTKYRTDPEVFAWPSSFAKWFPGLYIENTFGSGCMVNITVVELAIRYKTRKFVNYLDTAGHAASGYRAHTDSVTVFSTSPEVTSSNNIRMTIAQPIKDMVSQGKVVVMSPCGYLASVRIPAQELIDRYNSEDFEMAMVNNLVLNIPASTVPNSYNLRPAPNMLLVRRVDLLTFFAENKIPNNTKKTFWGSYNTNTGLYTFSSMRQYIVDLMKIGDKVSEEDMDFVVVPVNLTTETNSTSGVVYVTSCTPYIYQPTLCVLDMARASLAFTYTTKN